jgi:urease accessory protein
LTPLSTAAFLGLLRLASPALPVGGFSYSEGLESALEQGRVVGEAQIQAWLLDQLELAQGRAELPALAQAHAAWLTGDLAQAQALNLWVLHTRESAEFLQQTCQMGRSLQLWLAERHGDDPRIAQLGALAPAPCWPVGYALAAVLTGAAAEASLLAAAFGWAENMVQAALKTGALGQNAGQRMLGALADRIPEVVRSAIGRRASDRQAFALGLAIASAQHESQYSRLFRS